MNFDLLVDRIALVEVVAKVIEGHTLDDLVDDRYDVINGVRVGIEAEDRLVHLVGSDYRVCNNPSG